MLDLGRYVIDVNRIQNLLVRAQIDGVKVTGLTVVPEERAVSFRDKDVAT
jgi:hypothetical protein